MSNFTAIIPVRIDSEQRKNNIHVAVNYLLKNTKCKIIIKEDDSQQKLFFEKNDRIKYFFSENKTPIFHRTKLLNEMLSIVDTPVVANYDADIFLPPESYEISCKLILDDKYDVVYPYGFEQMDQIKVFTDSEDYKKFKTSFDINDIKFNSTNFHFCRYGHVQFFNTKSYINGFMENENYIDWGPEDEERGIRFKKLGYKVIWFRGLVFHQEHPPSIRKTQYQNNEILHESIKNLNKEQLLDYYLNQEYTKKYIL